MGKGLLIIILGSMMTLTFVSMTFVNNAYTGMQNAMVYYEDVFMRDVGNSFVNMMLSRIAEDFEYREEDKYDVLEKNMVDYFDAKVAYKVLDTVLVSQIGTFVGPPGLEGKDKDKLNHPEYWDYSDTGTDTVIKIQVKVVLENPEDPFKPFTKIITTYTMQNRAGGWIPPVVRGAWTANGDLNNTISDMYIDGRNHDLNLNLIPNTGTRAISSSVDFNNEENAAIGGTAYDSTDYFMQYPHLPATIEENYEWNGTFPETPDEILGYPEGLLIKLAKSGEMGSQYVLNPDKDIQKDLTFPLAGITYIEITDGEERELIMDGSDGKQNGGVLIVHGPNRQARLKGLKIDDGTKPPKTKSIIFCHDPGGPAEETMETDDEDEAQVHFDHGDILDECPDVLNSRFTGLIVTDYSFHHHLDILGAMLQLSPNLEMDKDCTGNKDHWVFYSEEAIRNATEITAQLSREMGNSDVRVFDVKGYGPGRQKASFWYE